ncbi:glycosyltransferase [Nanoarchaeota archaeon]
MKPEISVIVPVYNGERYIEGCLNSLLNQSLTKSKYEILIIDNGSTDKTPELVRKHKVKLFSEKKKGAANARNKGMKAAKGNLIVFTDSDCIANKDWLKNLLESSKSADAIAGEVIPYEKRTLAQKYIAKRRRSTKKSWELKRKTAPGYIRTSNFAVKRKVIKKVGFFDTRFANCGGEDDDYAWRVHWAGFKIAVNPKAKILHRDRDTLKALYKQTYRNGLAYCNLISKYPEIFGKIYIKRSALALPYNILAAPFKIIFSKKGERLYPLVDAMKSYYKLAGRINGSIKYKVLAL